jgi:hypothetical protein
MDYKIEYDGEFYNVYYGDNHLETFWSLSEALDYRAIMIWERDNAFQDYGTEWDIEMV